MERITNPMNVFIVVVCANKFLYKLPAITRATRSRVRVNSPIAILMSATKNLRFTNLFLNELINDANVK